MVPALCEVVTSKAAYTLGTIDNQTLQLLMDSGASCSVIHNDHVVTKEDKTSGTH